MAGVVRGLGGRVPPGMVALPDPGRLLLRMEAAIVPTQIQGSGVGVGV